MIKRYITSQPAANHPQASDSIVRRYVKNPVLRGALYAVGVLYLATVAALLMNPQPL